MENDLKYWAEYYYEFGFNVTCITNELNEYNYLFPDLLKSPNHIWYHLIHNRQEISEFKSYNWSKAVGIGCILGNFLNPLNENIRCLDIDGLTNFRALSGICEILGLPEKYEWIIESGSKNGAHIYFKTDEHNYSVLPGQTKAFPTDKKCDNLNGRIEKIFEQIELRWRYHMVLPPSIHKSYNKYSFWNSKWYNDYKFRPKEPPIPIPIKKVYFLMEYLYPDSPIKIDLSGKGPSSDHYIDCSVEDYKQYENKYYLVFDTETNGLPHDMHESPSNYKNWPELIQISWYLFTDNALIVSHGNYLIYNQNPNLKTEVTKLTGINDSILKDQRHATSIEEVLTKFNLDLNKADYLISHNMEFDRNVMAAEYIKSGLTVPFKGKKEICTMKSSVDFCSLQNNKWPTVEELYSCLFGEQIKQKHNALDDVKIISKCFWELKRRNLLDL